MSIVVSENCEQSERDIIFRTKLIFPNLQQKNYKPQHELLLSRDFEKLSFVLVA